MLLEPTEKYIKFIQRKKYYHNSPKYMFNNDLDCMYRQGQPIGKELSYVVDFLMLYKHANPFGAAKRFVEARRKMKASEFCALNKNS